LTFENTAIKYNHKLVIPTQEESHQTTQVTEVPPSSE